MFDVRGYAEKVNRMRKQGETITNMFLPVSSLDKIAQQEDSQLYFNEGVLAFTYSDNGVNRLCFHLSSLEQAQNLDRLLEKTEKRPLVADCVGREENILLLSEALIQVGFFVYARMSRWHGSSIAHFPELERKVFIAAKAKHTESIQRLFMESFDPLISHLPNTEKLQSLIAKDLVFCLEEQKHVQAVACLERIGKKGIYLYQYAVSKAYWKKNTGSAIFQYALEQFSACNSFTSWTTDDNAASNRIHEKFGMKRDGLKNIILIYP